jgi:hypothetical protein
MCVTVQALLGALALRVLHEGYEPTESEIATLVRGGCTEDEVRTALDRARARRLSGGETGADS